MGAVISILVIIVCLLLLLVILVQNPKGGGLSAGFGSATQLGGVRKTTDFLEKATWTFAIALVVLSMFSTAVTTGSSTAQTESALEEYAGNLPSGMQPQQGQPGQPTTPGGGAPAQPTPPPPANQ